MNRSAGGRERRIGGYGIGRKMHDTKPILLACACGFSIEKARPELIPAGFVVLGGEDLKQ